MSKKQPKERPPSQQPPDDFCEWWNPTRRDEPSGADVGGHPDAERVWARKDPGRWVRRTYGINAVLAWQAEPYRQEYLRWVDADRPEREPFVSIAAPLEKQRAFYRGLKATIDQIAKPMPKEDKQPLPNALDGESDRFPGDAIDF
jgi:hypothetical protein